MAEFLYREANRQRQLGRTAAGEPLIERARTGYGYLVQLGQMLTSKLELTARWEELKGTDHALRLEARTAGRQLGGGLNLYLNGHAFKLQSDYFYVFGRELSGGHHLARVQLDASF